MASSTEIAAMRQAILLSAFGLGTTSPNPPVGCVILDARGQVAGMGFHRRKGEAHAEVNALNAAGAAALGGTAVVTLEPCNHVGVTPACHQALLDAGITRVVVGLIDPTSRGDGGAAVLAAAGLEVEVGVLRDEVLTVIQPWLTATIRGGPHVTWVYDAVGGRRIDDFLLNSLRPMVDVIVSDGVIEEGSVGGHSSRHFRIADLSPIALQTDNWLSAAHRAGVRTMLLIGQCGDGERMLAAGRIDEILLIAPRTKILDSAAFTPLASTVFRCVDIREVEDTLLMRFRKHAKT